ncbi:MAG TPA: guanylate kinase [Actinomycetota bacterium]
MTDQRGRLFVVAGPSGVGKGTVVRRVLERVPRTRLSVSATTRPPRPSERDGTDYLFLTEEAFEALALEGGLLEHAKVFGHRYGTPRRWVEETLRHGLDVVLEIDVQGARQVREAVPEAVLVFLAPPSLEELERRLRSRGTEDEETLARRLAEAGWELEQRSWFDHVVVNEDVERASAQVAAIIEGFRTLPEGPAHP